jgi:hypothetical protein
LDKSAGNGQIVINSLNQMLVNTGRPSLSEEESTNHLLRDSRIASAAKASKIVSDVL